MGSRRSNTIPGSKVAFALGIDFNTNQYQLQMKQTLASSLQELTKFLFHIADDDAWKHDQRSKKEKAEQSAHDLMTKTTSTWKKTNWNLN